MQVACKVYGRESQPQKQPHWVPEILGERNQGANQPTSQPTNGESISLKVEKRLTIVRLTVKLTVPFLRFW